MVQCGIMTLTVPSALLSIMGVKTGVNDVYTEIVMDQAWTAIISIVLYTLLTFGFKQYFNVQTARNAMKNAQDGSHTASLRSNTGGNYVKFEDNSDEEINENGNNKGKTQNLVVNDMQNLTSIDQ